MSVMSWVRSRIIEPRPAGPERLLRRFTPAVDHPIHQDAITTTPESWRVQTRGRRSFRLFELRERLPAACLLTYRAWMRSENVRPRAYLEMWCHIPDVGEFASRGIHTALTGDNGWVICETRFRLKPGLLPDAIKLNIAFDGPGAVEISDISLTATPLA
ncbi:MAG TPA: hypothetical protein VKZ96_12800 [Thermomicrobiales bacterium]|nr:hypothetical protein [Thermomicrobiales bacterium]